MKIKVSLPRIKPSRPAEVTTLIHFGENTLRLLQVEISPKGPQILALKTKPISGAFTSEDLTTLSQDLPAPAGKVILVLSKSSVLTRYLTLPSDDPGELAEMARYQIADSIPYPIQECVVTIQPLQKSDKKTKVLALILLKSTLDQYLASLRKVGLEPQAVALSSEGISRWHQALLPKGAKTPQMILECLNDTLELAIVDQEKILSMRTLPLSRDSENFNPWLLTQAKETLQSYEQERVGPPVAAISVSGTLLTGQGIVATLSEHLNLPVSVADPIGSPFTQVLSHQAEELTKLSWSDLFGLACTKTPLTIDLLPLDAKQAQAAQHTQRLALNLIAWIGICSWVAAATLGVATFKLYREGQQMKTQQIQHQSQASRAEALAKHLKKLSEAQAGYASRMSLLTQIQSQMPQGVSLEHLSLNSSQLSLEGSAPTLGEVMLWVNQLSQTPSLADVSLNRTTSDEKGGRIRFTVEARVP